MGRVARGGERHQAVADRDTEEGLQEHDRDGTRGYNINLMQDLEKI